MRIISHRGNVNGPTPRENSPTYIDCAIGLGLDVEVDVRLIDGEFMLGHDKPQYLVTKRWLEVRASNLWIHCKDLAAAKAMRYVKGAQYFCHSSDPYVLTSTGHLWVHDLTLEIDEACVIPLLTRHDVSTFDRRVPFAVCTDYTTFAVHNLTTKGLT